MESVHMQSTSQDSELYQELILHPFVIDVFPQDAGNENIC